MSVQKAANKESSQSVLKNYNYSTTLCLQKLCQRWQAVVSTSMDYCCTFNFPFPFRTQNSVFSLVDCYWLWKKTRLCSIIIIIISKTMFMVLSSWQSHCENSPGSFDECRTASSGCRPKTKPDNLGCESACAGCQNLHSPSPFIVITQYSAQKLILILPSHRG